jgi:hypothetical protein
LAYFVLWVASQWIICEKAGEPGWACLIPVYNLIVLCRIAGKSGWWILWLFVPFINFVFAIILIMDLAKSFGKGLGFALGLIFLPFIFVPLLAFGDATHVSQTAPIRRRPVLLDEDA